MCLVIKADSTCLICFVSVVTGCGCVCLGVLVACKVSAKSDDWESPKCVIHTSWQVPFFVKFSEFLRIARAIPDSMCLDGFCFGWVPVVGDGAFRCALVVTKSRENLTIGSPQNV